MTLISKEQIVALHDVNQENCISIFIPTHRGGKKVLDGEDSLVLKNQLKDVKDKLSKRGLNSDVIDNLTKPVQELIDNSSFWREQSDGLAIFIADNFFEKYTLPVHFEEFNYISNSFYLKPLMPMFEGDGEFYLMLLDRSNVKLYQCTKHSFTEIIVDDLIPETKQDRVGFDYEEKNLQFRTSHAGSGQAIFHGQEAATGKLKNEIKKYFRAINDGLLPILKDGIPMLIASQDFLFDIYNGINSYPNLTEKNIKVNFEDTEIFEIHEMAWENISPLFEQKRTDKIAAFLAEQGSGKTAIGIDRILLAAINGKVDTLFCENREDIFGNYTVENDDITVTQNEESDTTVSLMNVAAIQTFLNGGKVYLLENETMPNPNSRVNALYRY